MIKLSKSLQYIAAFLLVIGVLLKISHVIPYGIYVTSSGLLIYALAGILEFSFSSIRTFNTYSKLIASVLIFIASIYDLIYTTSTIYIALIFLAITFISSALPQNKIPR